jgi:hypothetical protein
MQNTLKTPLTNVQLEILKSFSHQLNSNDLKEFKNMIANFFAKRLISEADKVYEQNNWNDKKVDELLTTKIRKKSK